MLLAVYTTLHLYGPMNIVGNLQTVQDHKTFSLFDYRMHSCFDMLYAGCILIGLYVLVEG